MSDPTTRSGRVSEEGLIWVAEIMELVRKYGASTHPNQFMYHPDDVWKEVRAAITALAAECERMRPVYVAALGLGMSLTPIAHGNPAMGDQGWYRLRALHEAVQKALATAPTPAASEEVSG